MQDRKRREEMGTRYLTVVVNNRKPVIAQTGFFDGDPFSNGLKILRILKKDKEQYIRTQLHRCSTLDEAEYRRFYKDYWLDEEALNKEHPRFWWYDGADLLETLLETDKKPECRFSLEFAYDSLQCEWAYVIDYDLQTFEVYKGWSIVPLQPDERFYNEGKAQNGYYPVHRAATYCLYELPDEEVFRNTAWRHADNLRVHSVKAILRDERTGSPLYEDISFSLLATLNNENRLSSVAYIPRIIIGEEVEMLKEDKTLAIITGKVLEHTQEGNVHTLKLRHITYTFEEMEKKKT